MSFSNITSHIAPCSLMLVSSIAIMVYVALNMLREALQIYQQRWKYIFEPNNLVYWVLYIAAVIMVSPVFNDGCVSDFHFSATSIAVFLSWFNLLLFLQRFDQVRIRISIAVYLIADALDLLPISDWNLRRDVFGDSTNADKSASGILDSDHCVRHGLLHSALEFGQHECEQRIQCSLA